MHQTAVISCLSVELPLLPLGQSSSREITFSCLHGTYLVVPISLGVWSAGSLQPHSSWGTRRCPGSALRRTLQGEIALVSVEGCPKRQQREEKQHQGQSLAVGKDLCHGMMFSPTGFAWMWPVCVRCVSPPPPPHPGYVPLLLTALVGSVNSPVSPHNPTHSCSEHWHSCCFQLIQCFVTTGQQPVESPPPKSLKVLFSLSLFLHCKMQYGHSIRRQILLHGRGREENGQLTGVHLLFRACRLQEMCSLTKKDLLQDARRFKAQWGHCSLPTAFFPSQ